MKESNILTCTLQNFGVKFTKKYSCDLFHTHPHKSNLFGISRMLSEYTISNGGVKIENKTEDLALIDLPFIAHSSNEFVLVTKVTSEIVTYEWNGKVLSIPYSDFCQNWSGYSLLLEKPKHAIEVNYKENKRQEYIGMLKNVILLLFVAIAVVVFYSKANFYGNLITNILFFSNILGIYISSLLLHKQLGLTNTYADKICSAFKQGDCKNVLESKAGSFFGLFTWSEIGISYYIGNCLFMLFFHEYLSVLLISSLLTIFYSFWSLWYQMSVAKQWCPLCVIVQVLNWMIFALTILISVFVGIESSQGFIILLFIYSFILLVINMTISSSNKEEMMSKSYELNSIKSNSEVFDLLLKNSSHFDLNKSSSKVLLGNISSSNLITVLSNPHCHPCAEMHHKIDKLLLTNSQNICVQYVFTYFNYAEQLELSNYFLIYSFMYLDSKTSQSIFEEWFSGKESFFYEKSRNNYPNLKQLYIDWFIIKQEGNTHCVEFTFEDERCLKEVEKHKQLSEVINHQGTPTIFINGYVLPDSYNFNDLKLVLSNN